MTPEERSRIRTGVIAGLIVALLVAAATFAVKRVTGSGTDAGGPGTTVETTARSTASTPSSPTEPISSTPPLPPTTPPTEPPETPRDIWPQIVDEGDIKEGQPSLEGGTSGRGTTFSTGISFGTNGFQGTRSISLYIPSGAKYFEATLGETQKSDEGAVNTRISVDEQTVAAYGVGYFDEQPISVPVDGGSLLTLTVTITKGGGAVPSVQAVLYGDARFTN